jgi:hypothetical protein
METVRVEQHTFSAWLFSIGFLHLSLWKGALAMGLWSYFLDMTFSSLLK